MPEEELEAVPDLDEDKTEESQEETADTETEEVTAEDIPEQDAAVENPSEESSEEIEEEAKADPEVDSSLDNINKIKENLSKDLIIIDEALSDEEFLEKINSQNVFERFEKYIKYQVNTVSDFEAIAKSRFLQVLILVGFMGILGLFFWSSGFGDHEDHKHLVGYIKINHKLPDNFEGPIPEEVKEVVIKYAKHPEKYLEHDDLPHYLQHHHHAKKEVIMSEKYPGLITNDQLLLILEEQDLGKVSARGTEYTEKINLSGLDLRSVDFKYLNKFIQSNLKGVNLVGVYIEDAQFRGANLEEADLSLADLRDSSFIRAKVRRTKFIETDLTNSNFYGAKGDLVNFTKSFLAGTNFKEVSMKEAQFVGALAFSTNFRDSFLLGVNFSDAQLANANFKGANLTAVNFHGANLQGANFEGAILRAANFSDANVLNANFTHAQVQKAFLADAKEISLEQLEAADKSHHAASLPEWVNKSKLSWKKRF